MEGSSARRPWNAIVWDPHARLTALVVLMAVAFGMIVPFMVKLAKQILLKIRFKPEKLGWWIGFSVIVSRRFIPVRYSICNSGLKILESKDLASLLDI